MSLPTRWHCVVAISGNYALSHLIHTLPVDGVGLKERFPAEMPSGSHPGVVTCSDGLWAAVAPEVKGSAGIHTVFNECR